MDFLHHLFSHLCGQVNCWHAAGVTSVACQRCTGLYIGALIAAVLFVIFRPRPTSFSLWLHGLAMLVIIPFGYHLVPHGTLVRAITGQLFGYGMAYYLLLVPADRFDLWRFLAPYPSGEAGRWSGLFYLLVLLIAIPGVLLLATSGLPGCIALLSYLSFVGLMTVTYLVSWNALILATIGWIRLRERTSVAS